MWLLSLPGSMSFQGPLRAEGPGLGWSVGVVGGTEPLEHMPRTHAPHRSHTRCPGSPGSTCPGGRGRGRPEAVQRGRATSDPSAPGTPSRLLVLSLVVLWVRAPRPQGSRAPAGRPSAGPMGRRRGRKKGPSWWWGAVSGTGLPLCFSAAPGPQASSRLVWGLPRALPTRLTVPWAPPGRHWLRGPGHRVPSSWSPPGGGGT